MKKSTYKVGRLHIPFANVRIFRTLARKEYINIGINPMSLNYFSRI